MTAKRGARSCAAVANVARLASAFVLTSCAPTKTQTNAANTSPTRTSYAATIAPATSAFAVAATKDASKELDDASAPIATIDPSEGVGLAEGPSGYVGAFLALGPFRLPEKPALASVDAWKLAPSVDDRALRAAYDATLAGSLPSDATVDPASLPQADVATREIGKDKKPTSKIVGWSKAIARWSIVASGEGAIDLEKQLGSGGKPAIAYLASTLRLPTAQKLVLLVGADDGCEVIVDGVSRFVRDASRAQRDDDDLVPLDLAAGDHAFLFKLHQRDAGWAIHVRLVDETLRPPLGARWLLPKAPSAIAERLAGELSWVRIVRAPSAEGYATTMEARYPEGGPIAPTIDVFADVTTLEGAPVLERRRLGAIAIGPRAMVPFEGSIARLSTATSSASAAAPLVANGDGTFPFGDREGGDFHVHVDLVDARASATTSPLRSVEGGFHPRKETRTAIADAKAIVASWAGGARPTNLADDVEATLTYLADRLADQVSHGDEDVADELVDAKVLAAFVADAKEAKDPIAARTGVMRIAHLARADEKPQPLALHVPPSLAKLDAKSTKKYPLYVGLHGMNGGPMSMMRVFFGGDEPNKSMFELERPTPDYWSMKSFEGFVLAPHAHGNAMYRQLGEEEVMDAIAWARARYPQIDADRIYVTGFSMGGIGAAALPLHHPDVFAAAQPLCGYHSYFVRRDVQGKPHRPWEEILLEERSNVAWADNGARLPLWIVHGTHDLPTENSSVLVDAYEKLGFSVKHDEPDKGHDVWGWAYDELQQVKWLAPHRRVAHPAHVRFKTTRPRFGDDAWVHLERLSAPASWAIVNARVDSKSKIRVTTKGADALRLDRDATLLGEGSITVAIDDTTLTFGAGESMVMHREGDAWKSGAPPRSAGELHKEGKITGPIRDVWSDPLVVVYGTQDPTQTEANLEVARSLARIRWGTDVAYPIVKDVDVDPNALPKSAMILIGNPKSNRLTRAWEKDLPITVKDRTLEFAGKTFTGDQLGAAFVVPHPLAHDRYLLVVEGIDALGTFRALSLPELLPDFVIWDAELAPARGQTLLSFGSVLAAGYFGMDWSAPKEFEDPLRDKVGKPKSERDATAYLP